MDNLKLAGEQDFALTVDALAFMQSSYALLEQLGAIAGVNYILSGCVVTGGSAASGYMVLNGILMPFTGGAIGTTVKIKETVTVVAVGTGSREETVYNAEFGTSGNPALNFNWGALDAARIKTNQALNTLIDAINTRLPLTETTIEIGPWDMDTTTGDGDEFIAVAHGLDLSKIRQVEGIIYNDAMTIGHLLPTVRVSGDIQVCISSISETLIYLERLTGGAFDSSLFDDDTMNRGYIVIKHLP